MRFSHIIAASMASTAVAQDSVCDKYTKALFKDNTAKNQATLLTALVNTVVIGNYTMPNVGIKVPGILAKGEVDGKMVDLLPYFSGELASTNRGDKATCVNFLDDGGAEPLMKNMPANGKESKQYFLLTHLYQFFGALLKCSQQGMTGFDKYDGQPSMYKVHKFMNLGNAEMTYFVTQVGLAAASFGVAKEDVAAVGKALLDTFNMKCSAPVELIPGSGPLPQAICIADNCMQAKDAKCDAYAKAEAPVKCTAKPTGGMNGTATATPAPSGSATGTAKPPVATGAAGVNAVNFAALAAGVAALVL